MGMFDNLVISPEVIEEMRKAEEAKAVEVAASAAAYAAANPNDAAAQAAAAEARNRALAFAADQRYDQIAVDDVISNQANESDTSDMPNQGSNIGPSLFPRFNIFGNDPDSIQSTIPTSFPGGSDLVDVSVEEAEAAIAANFTPEERAAWEAAIAEQLAKIEAEAQARDAADLTGDDPDLTGGDPDLTGTTQVVDAEGNPLFEPGVIYGPNGDPIDIDGLPNSFPPFEGEEIIIPPPVIPPPTTTEEETAEEEAAAAEAAAEEAAAAEAAAAEAAAAEAAEAAAAEEAAAEENGSPAFGDDEWEYLGNGRWKNKETNATVTDPSWEDYEGEDRDYNSYPRWAREHPWIYLGNGKYRNIFTGATRDDPTYDPDNDTEEGTRVGAGEEEVEGTTEEIDTTPVPVNGVCPVGWVNVGGVCISKPDDANDNGDDSDDTNDAGDDGLGDAGDGDDGSGDDGSGDDGSGDGDDGDGDDGSGDDGDGDGDGGEGEGEGGGGGFSKPAGSFSPSSVMSGNAPMLQLPAFRPVMPQQKDYTIALNNIIQESLFEGMI